MCLKWLLEQENEIAFCNDQNYERKFEQMKEYLLTIADETHDEDLIRKVKELFEPFKDGVISNANCEVISRKIDRLTEEFRHSMKATENQLQKIKKGNIRMEKKLDEVLERLENISQSNYALPKSIPDIPVKIRLNEISPETEEVASEKIVETLNHTEAESKLSDAIEDLNKKFNENGYSITNNFKVVCVQMYIRCTSALSLFTLLKDYVSGRLDAALEPLEKAARMLDGCERVKLKTIIFEEDILNILSSFSTNLETAQSDSSPTNDNEDEDSSNPTEKLNAFEIEELFVMVQQMQTTNQAVLQRLDRMSDDTRRTCDQCQCSKHLEDTLSEIKSLKSRVQMLEEQDTVSGQSVKSAEAQLQELNAKLEKIALNVQTDDSKLKRFELVGGKTTPNAQVTSHGLRHKQDSVLKTSSNQTEKISEATVMTCEVENAKPNFVNEDVTRAEQPEQSGAYAEGRVYEELQVDSKNQKTSIEVVGQVKNLPLQITSKDEAKVLTLRPETPIKAQSVQIPSTGNIAKPNFGVREPANILEVEIVEQKEQKSYFSSFEWEIQAQHELQSAKLTELRHLRGIHDVILLDISASMASAWSQVRTFINDFLSGLEDIAQKGLNQENVALVTFGHETKVQQRLTNNFSEIRQAFSRLKVGGPSPLTAGMIFALAAAASPDSFVCSINGIHQGTRFILITDGEPTDPFTHQGPDIPDSRREEETKTHIVSYMEKILVMQGELCCVPVGNANKEFLSTLVSFCDGKMVDYTGGRQLSRKVFLMVQPGSLGLRLPFLSRGVEDLSEGDRRDIEEFGKKERRRLESGIRERNHSYLESTNKKLPKVGSRVRRGPDWHYDNQDSEGPGTVIGHCMGDERVFVNWDRNNYIDKYHYGEMHQYDILLVDEPRRLGPGETIAVGCIVSPGPFWKPQDGVATTDTGVVIKLDLGPSNKPQATVRWDNGKRGDYLYDVDDKPEIQVGFSTVTPVVTQSGETQHSLPPPKKRKNKNKYKNVT